MSEVKRTNMSEAQMEKAIDALTLAAKTKPWVLKQAIMSEVRIIKRKLKKLRTDIKNRKEED